MSSIFRARLVLATLTILMTVIKADLLHVSSPQLQHASLQWKCIGDRQVQIHVFTVWNSDSFPVVFAGAQFLWPSSGSNAAFVRFGDGFTQFDPVFLVSSLDTTAKTVLAEAYINHTYTAALSPSQQPWIAEANLCCVLGAASATGPSSSRGIVLRALVVAKLSLSAPFLWLPPVSFVRKGSNQQQSAAVAYYTRKQHSSVITLSDPVDMAASGFIESSFNKHPLPDGISLAADANAVVFQFDSALQKFTAFSSAACTSLVLSASSRIDLLSLSISSQVVSTVCEGTNPIFAHTTARAVSYEAIAVPSAVSLSFFTTSPSLSNLRFSVLSQPKSLLLLPGPVQVGDECRSLSSSITASAFVSCMRIAVKWIPSLEDVGDTALSILTFSTDVLTGSVVIGDAVSLVLYVAPPVAPSITFDESSTLSIPVRLNELVTVDLRSSAVGAITSTKPLPRNAALLSTQASHSVFAFRPSPLQGSLSETFCFQQSHSNLTVTSCLYVRVLLCCCLFVCVR